MATYTGINHLALVTGDMDATVRFWRDLLGMRLVAGLGSGHGDRRSRQYFLEAGGRTLVAFFEWDGVESVAEKEHGYPAKGPVAFDHVAVGVASDDDLWELKGRLEAAGFWASELIDHGFIHSLYSFDPNNIAIEFSALVSGVDLSTRPRMLDRHPTRTAQEGSEPVPGIWPAVGQPIPSEDRQVYPGEGADLADRRDSADWPDSSDTSRD